MRLLLIEDNDRLAGGNSQGHSSAGVVLRYLRVSPHAAPSPAAHRYDVHGLHLGLPYGDGMEFLAATRDGGTHVPILVLTARDGLPDRVKGLNAGADDYLLKPFAMDELVARLKALLRRPGAVL